MKVEHIKELIATLEKSNLQELDFQDGDIRLTLKKNSTDPLNPVTLQQVPVVENKVATEIVPQKEATAQKKSNENKDLHYIESPLVGTFYRASGPEAAPFVEVGSSVKKGDPLCIIEAMKIMNIIEAEISGVVEAIYVENSHFVEYKSKIMAIKKS